MGTVFRTVNGHPHAIYSFCLASGCPDGSAPYTGLVQARDGNFYGGTVLGGAFNQGTIFRITASGALTVLHNFCAQSKCRDGAGVYGTLVQAANGYLYGLTARGGTSGDGTIFRISPSGSFKTLHSFCTQANCADGVSSGSPLLEASNGMLYGTAIQGGANHGGTIFQITPSGTFKKIYDFCSQANCADGSNPGAELIQATDGNLYGTTVSGGTQYFGTIFQITPDGVLTTLHSFNNTDGNAPNALVQFTDGNFYGSTAFGGLVSTCDPSVPGCGAVYSLSMGLKPFVKLLWRWGKVGSSAVMYGTNLSGATKVTFNGVIASFIVVSSTEISATVPAGATTGKVQVTTPSATLNSNAAFNVIP